MWAEKEKKKGKKKKASAFFHMFCKETVQMDYLLVWSFLLPQPAQVQVALYLPETHTYAHTQTKAFTLLPSEVQQAITD